MKRSLIYSAIAILTIVCTVYLFSEESLTVEKGEIIGNISRSKGSKELLVKYPAAGASKIKMGSKLYVVSEKNGKPVIITLEVTFPMMTQAKLKVAKTSAEYAALISDKAKVYLSASISEETKAAPLPPDNEISVNMRQYAGSAFIVKYSRDVKTWMTEFKGPEKTFFNPDFSETWKQFSRNYVAVPQTGTEPAKLGVITGQLDSVFGVIYIFHDAASKYLKAQISDPAAAAKTSFDDDECEKKLLGDKLIKIKSYDENYNRIKPFNFYNPQTLDKLGATLYPRDGLFGSIPAKKIYEMYSLHVRFFARLAVKINKDKAFHKQIAAIQKKAIDKKSYICDDMEKALTKAGIPDFYSSERGKIKNQFGSFYTRRELDGTIGVILKYVWMAIREFDPEFYNQPDIKAFEKKIPSL